VQIAGVNLGKVLAAPAANAPGLSLSRARDPIRPAFARHFLEKGVGPSNEV